MPCGRRLEELLVRAPCEELVSRGLQQQPSIMSAGDQATHLFVTAFATQAARDIADTLSKGRGVVYLPNSGNMLLGLNTSNM